MASKPVRARETLLPTNTTSATSACDDGQGTGPRVKSQQLEANVSVLEAADKKLEPSPEKRQQLNTLDISQNENVRAQRPRHLSQRGELHFINCCAHCVCDHVIISLARNSQLPLSEHGPQQRLSLWRLRR